MGSEFQSEPRVGVEVVSGSAKDGTKRWAIAPPPPSTPANTAISGEFTLSLNGDHLTPDSGVECGSRPERSVILHNSNARTLPPPDEAEPFDSDRLTDTPFPPSASLLLMDRDHPTIPAPLWADADLPARPAPQVATRRGFFLETLACEADLTSTSLSDVPGELVVEFDVDDTL